MADATTVGFDWLAPENQAERLRHAGTLALLQQVRQVAGQMDDSAVRGRQLLGIVEAGGLDLLTNLPPLPLPGDLAPLSVDDLRALMPVWQALIDYLKASRDYTVTVGASR